MKEPFDKISSYNVFKCLFPRIVFSVTATNGQKSIGKS